MAPVCERCGEELSETRPACPNCGYDPSRFAVVSGWVELGVGLLLTLTGIGAIFGIPLVLYGAYLLYRAVTESPAVEESNASEDERSTARHPP